MGYIWDSVSVHYRGMKGVLLEEFHCSTIFKKPKDEELYMINDMMTDYSLTVSVVGSDLSPPFLEAASVVRWAATHCDVVGLLCGAG